MPLPTELLLDVFFALPDLRSVLQLSSANKRLRQVWVEHADAIVFAQACTLRPAGLSALALALAEAGEIELALRTCNGGEHNDNNNTREKENEQQAIGRDLRATLSSWLPLLERNAILQNQVAEQYHKHWTKTIDKYHAGLIPMEEPEVQMRTCLRYMPDAYYLQRRLVVAWSRRELLPSLRSVLQAMTNESLDAHLHFVGFMVFPGVDPGLRRIHNMDRPKEEYGVEDEGARFVHTRAWRWARRQMQVEARLRPLYPEIESDLTDEEAIISWGEEIE